MPYRFLEKVATADVAFEATGKTPRELFISAAKALEEAQVDTKQLANSEQRTVSLENETLEGLLFDFLNELIFLKDAEGLAFAKQNIKIQKDNNTKWRLEGRLLGEGIDPKPRAPDRYQGSDEA